MTGDGKGNLKPLLSSAPTSPNQQSPTNDTTAQSIELTPKQSIPPQNASMDTAEALDATNAYVIDAETQTKTTHPVMTADEQTGPTVDEQVTAYEKMLSEARGKLDQELADEQLRVEAMLNRREALVRKLWWILLILHPVIIIISCLGWAAMFDAHKDIHDWHYNTSFADLIIAFGVRAVLGLAAVLTTITDERRVPYVHEIGYWAVAFTFTFNIAKLMMMKWSSRAEVIVMGVVSMIFSTVLLFLHQFFAKLDTMSWTDDDDEKEATARRAKLHAEATERAAAIAVRLTGKALEQHLEMEEKRVIAYEFVEKQIVRGKIVKRNEERVSFLQFIAFLRPYFWPKNTKGSFVAHFIVILSLLLLVASKAASILSPLYIGYAVDKLVEKNEMPWSDLTIYATLAFGSQLLKQLQNAVYLKVKQVAFVEISSGLLRHTLSLSHSFHSAKSMGKLVRSIDRGLLSCENVVNYLFLLVVPSFAEALIVFVIFYVKFNSGLLASIVFLHLVMYAVSTVQITIFRKPLRAVMTKYDNKYHDILTEALLNFDTIKIFNTEQYENDRYTAAVANFQKHAVATQVTLSFLNAFQQLTIQSTILCCAFVTAYDIKSGALTIGALSSVTSYIMSIFSHLSFLGTIFDMTISSVVDTGAIITLSRIEPEIKDVENPSELVLPSDGSSPVIKFENVCFTYDSATGRGLKNINLELKGSNALVGHTGSFKSTITKLILRFYKPNSGRILINGQDIQNVSNTSLKAAICAVPQQTTLFNDTLLANLMYGNQDATMNQVITAVKAAGLYDFIMNLPRQFLELVGTRGHKLSGGELQRVSIARCLVRALKLKPNQDKIGATAIDDYSFSGILLCDEYSSALDSKTEKDVQEQLAKLQRGGGICSIVVSHRLTTAMHCDNIIVMREGEVLEQGRHEALLQKGGAYAELWNKQFLNPDEIE